MGMFTGSLFPVMMDEPDKDPSRLVCPILSCVAGRWEKPRGKRCLGGSWANLVKNCWRTVNRDDHDATFLKSILENNCTLKSKECNNFIFFFFKKENSEYVGHHVYVMCQCCLNDLAWWLPLHIEDLLSGSVLMILKTWIREASAGLQPEPLQYPCVPWFASCVCASIDTRSC